MASKIHKKLEKLKHKANAMKLIRRHSSKRALLTQLCPECLQQATNLPNLMRESKDKGEKYFSVKWCKSCTPIAEKIYNKKVE